MSYEKLLEEIAKKERSIGMTEAEREALTARLLEEREGPEEEPAEELVEEADDSAKKGEFKKAFNDYDSAKQAGAKVAMIERKMAELAERIVKARKLDAELLEVARLAAEYAKQLAEEHRK